MGSDTGSTFANVAGRGIGVLAALQSLGSPGGLANFMLQRQRLLTDPALRETLVGSPFASGFFQVGGERVSPGRALVAAPSAFMGPTIPTAAGPAELGWAPAEWRPRLPPLGPEQAAASAAQSGIVEALASGDPLRVAQAKMTLKIPLTPEEQAQAAAAAGALQSTVQAQTGAPATVSHDIPGGQLTIGSPYAGLGTSGFLSPELAAEAARRTGKIAVPTDRGWQLMEPERPPTVVETPAQGEMPLERLRPQLLPGQVPQATGRTLPDGTPLYQAVTPPKPPEAPLPPLQPLPGQPGYQVPGAPQAGAFAPSAFVAGMVQRGWAPEEAAAVAGNVVAESGFRPGIQERAPTAGRGGYGLIQWTGPRRVGLERFATATGRSPADPEAQMDWLALERTGASTMYGGSDERAAFTKAFAGGGSAPELAQRFGQHVERPANLRATVGLRRAAAGLYGGGAPVQVAAAPVAAPPVVARPTSGIFTSGVAQAAEIPPGAVVAPPPPPAPLRRPPPTAAPQPVVAAPPPAPAPPPPPPRPRTAADVVPGLPRPEERIGYPPPAPAEAVPGAAPPLPPIPSVEPAPVAPAVPQVPTQAQPLVVKRETQKGPTGERTLESAELPAEAATKAVGTLVNYRNYAQRLHAAFPDPAERAKYVGWMQRPKRELFQLASADPRFSDFKTLMAPFQLSFFDRAGAALTEFEIAILRESLPTGKEVTPTDFESKLAYFPDLVEEQLAWRLAQQRTPIEAQTAEWADTVQRQIDEARTDRWKARGLGPPAAPTEPTAAPAAPPPPGTPPPAATGPPPAAAPGKGPPAAGPPAAPQARAGVLPRIARAVVAPERSLFSLAPSIGLGTLGGLGGAAGGAMVGSMLGPLAPVAVPAGALLGATLGSMGGEAAQMGAEALGAPQATEAPAGERLTEAGIRGAAGEVIGAPLAAVGRVSARPFLRAAEAIAPVIRGPAAPWRVTTGGELARATVSRVGGEKRVLANVLRDPEELAKVSLTPENRERLMAAWWRSNAQGGRRGLVRAFDDLPDQARENLFGKYRGDMDTLIAAAKRSTGADWQRLMTLGGGGALGYFGGLPGLGTAVPLATEASIRGPGLLMTPRLGAGVAGPFLRWGAAGARRAATQTAAGAGLRQ